MNAVELLKAMADGVRLRIIRAVAVAELSVAELVNVLSLPQSTVSRQLKTLRDARLLETRRDGTFIYYRRGPALSDPALAQFLDAQLDHLAKAAEDRQAVRRVLSMRGQRSREFFDQVAGRYGSLSEPGGGWPALAAAMAAGFRGQDVADLGAGEGDVTLLLARFARSVLALDASPEMLKHLEQRMRQQQFGKHVQLVHGDLAELPIADASVDAAFLSQSLHHVGQPEMAIHEAARILRPGGVLIVLDLHQHDQEWMREQWADLWLGFDPHQIEEWMTNAGLIPERTDELPGGESAIHVLMMVARKVVDGNRTQTEGEGDGNTSNRAQAQNDK